MANRKPTTTIAGLARIKQAAASLADEGANLVETLHQRTRPEDDTRSDYEALLDLELLRAARAALDGLIEIFTEGVYAKEPDQ
jgi:hypothetical protein